MAQVSEALTLNAASPCLMWLWLCVCLCSQSVELRLEFANGVCWTSRRHHEFLYLPLRSEHHVSKLRQHCSCVESGNVRPSRPVSWPDHFLKCPLVKKITLCCDVIVQVRHYSPSDVSGIANQLRAILFRFFHARRHLESRERAHVSHASRVS